MQVYPSWRYHKELEPKLIHSAEEEQKEWKDSPACFEAKEEIKIEMPKEESKKADELVKEVLSESLDEEIGKVKVKKGKK